MAFEPTADEPSESTPTTSNSRNQPESTPAENPWLTASSTSTKISRKKNNLVGREAEGAEKSAKAMKKSLSKTEEARQREREDAAVEIDPSHVSLANPDALASKSQPAAEKRRKGKKTKQAQAQEEVGSDSDLEDHEMQGPLAIRQRDLVAQAFAGDNVVEVCLDRFLCTL